MRPKTTEADHKKLWAVRLSTCTALLFVMAASALAHHARTEYDLSRTISMKATVTRVDWSNPHALIYFDVTDAAGNVQNWSAITGGPSRLQRTGWTSQTLKPGDAITITGNPQKSAGGRQIWLTSVVLPNGRELSMHR